MNNIHVQVLFFGRVQGVGFRWFVVDEAEKREVLGTVKNLSDGSVELYAFGAQDKVDALIASLKSHPGVERVRLHEKSLEVTYCGFKIVF